MTKRTLAAILAASLLAMMVGLADGGQMPIAVSGFDQNMIVGVGQTFSGSGITATMDGGTGLGGNTWYALGQNPDAATTGLPPGTITSASDATIQLSLQPAGGDNAVLINAGNTTGLLTLTSPAVYSALTLFGSTGNGANTVDYTLNFAGGSTQSGSVSFGDWFGGSPVAVDANGRISNTGYDAVNSGNPNIYEVPITFAPGLALDSISLTQDPTNGSGSGGGNGNTAIFALSGTPNPTPEPGSIILLVIGAAGLSVAGRRCRRPHR